MLAIRGTREATRIFHGPNSFILTYYQTSHLVHICTLKPLAVNSSSRRHSKSFNLNSGLKPPHKNLVRLVSNKTKIDKIKIKKRIMSFYDSDEDAFEPVITHGESVIDRKSVFQGHCAAIHRIEHVDILLSKLKENKKIENAFHNMWAYRIDKSDSKARVAGKSASILQDCDDDGEQAAGGRLLTLLQILNVVNVMVVVTRWYGGIQLGPARFKHINNAARDSLVKGGFVKDGGGESSNTTQQESKGRGKNKKKGR